MKSIEITLSTGATLKIWETGSAQKDEKGIVIESHNLQVYLKHPLGTIDRHTISLVEKKLPEFCPNCHGIMRPKSVVEICLTGELGLRVRGCCHACADAIAKRVNRAGTDEDILREYYSLYPPQ